MGKRGGGGKEPRIGGGEATNGSVKLLAPLRAPTLHHLGVLCLVHPLLVV